MLGPNERTGVFAKTATRVYGLGLLSLPRLAGSPSGMSAPGCLPVAMSSCPAASQLALVGTQSSSA